MTLTHLDHISTAHLADPARYRHLAMTQAELVDWLATELATPTGDAGPVDEPTTTAAALRRIRAHHRGEYLAETVCQVDHALCAHPAWRTRDRSRRLARALAVATGDPAATINVNLTLSATGTGSTP